MNNDNFMLGCFVGFIFCVLFVVVPIYATWQKQIKAAIAADVATYDENGKIVWRVGK